MPRAALADVSVKQLVAELKRRQAKLADLVKQRDALNEQIEELEGLGVKPLRASSSRKVAGKGKKPGPKPKTAKKAKAASKRKRFPETAEQFIVGLVKGKGAMTAEINQAWKDSGRAASADKTLSKMVKDGKIKRENIEGKRGSRYTKA
ncbi:MAG: hypothetical protein ACOC8H_01345 [bacterium]